MRHAARLGRWAARLAAFVVLTGFALQSARGQGTTTIAPDDPVYLDLDRLIAAGVTPRTAVGQRPYSRGELLRLGLGAQAFLDSASAEDRATFAPLRTSLVRVLSRLRDVPRDGSGEHFVPIAFLDRASAAMLLTDAPSRPFTSNGLGTIEADLNTLTDERAGRPFVVGSNLALEAGFGVAVRPGFSVQAAPRIWAYDPRNGVPAGIGGALLSGHARLVVGKAAITVGREYTSWSQAGGASLLLSSNAPATDMVRLSSDGPFTLPGMFGRVGPIAGTVQVADLGPSAANSHSLLVSYKLSALPSANLELGFSFLNHFGGAGARSSTASARFFDLTPFIDVFRHHSDSTDLDSDKLIGFDARLRLRRLAGITVFGEMALEDFDPKRVRGMLTDDAAYLGGVRIPRLVIPSLSSTIGYHRTGLRFYEHHLVTNGLASRRFTLGDDLGRDADGVRASVRWERSPALSLSIDGAYETRRNDMYEGVYQPGAGTGLTFRRVSTAPEEQRARGLLSVRRWSTDGRQLVEVRAGAERTSNFTGVVAPSKVHGVLEVMVTAFP